MKVNRKTLKIPHNFAISPHKSELFVQHEHKSLYFHMAYYIMYLCFSLFIDRYSSLMGVIAKKFAKKRQLSQMAENGEDPDETLPVKKKFLKPVDD